MSSTRVTGSVLLSVIADCQNCQLQTFEASYRIKGSEERIVYGAGSEWQIPDPPVTLRPFAITGQLCAEHWQTLYEMGSSAATSQPSPSRPTSPTASDPS